MTLVALPPATPDTPDASDTRPMMTRNVNNRAACFSTRQPETRVHCNALRWAALDQTALTLKDRNHHTNTLDMPTKRDVRPGPCHPCPPTPRPMLSRLRSRSCASRWDHRCCAWNPPNNSSLPGRTAPPKQSYSFICTTSQTRIRLVIFPFPPTSLTLCSLFPMSLLSSY